MASYIALDSPDSLAYIAPMFRCARCNEVIGPGVASHRVVVQRREKRYEPRYKLQKGKKKWDDPGGEGWEIVRENTVCVDCFRVVEDAPPQLDI
jgi:hypothetical protein